MIHPNKIRALLSQLGLSQQEAGRRLEIGERTMRRYCKDGAPLAIYLALQQLASK